MYEQGRCRVHRLLTNIVVRLNEIIDEILKAQVHLVLVECLERFSALRVQFVQTPKIANNTQGQLCVNEYCLRFLGGGPEFPPEFITRSPTHRQIIDKPRTQLNATRNL